MIEKLSLDIIKLIATYLSEREYRIMAVVCKKLRQIFEQLLKNYRGKIARIFLHDICLNVYRDHYLDIRIVLYVEEGVDRKYIRSRLEKYDVIFRQKYKEYIPPFADTRKYIGDNLHLDLRIAGVRKYLLFMYNFPGYINLFIELPAFVESIKTVSDRILGIEHQYMHKYIFCNNGPSRLRHISPDIEILIPSSFANLKKNIYDKIYFHSFHCKYEEDMKEKMAGKDIKKIIISTNDFGQSFLPIEKINRKWNKMRKDIPPQFDLAIKLYFAKHSIETLSFYTGMIIKDSRDISIKVYTDNLEDIVRHHLKDRNISIDNRGLLMEYL